MIIKDSDLKEDFVRSSGPGGQNVNKVSTCVILKHVPTGILIKCQEFRTQHQNRDRARALLTAELLRQEKVRVLACKAVREKRRRQTRGRSKVGKEKVLEFKRVKALKKKGRAKIFWQD